MFIRFTLGVKKSTRAVQYIERRAWRRLSKEKFAANLTESQLCCDPDVLEDMPIDDLVQLYKDQMTELLDKHCQLYEFGVETSRATERRYQRTRSDDDKRAWSSQLTTLKSLYKEKRDSYWRKEIDTCSGNMKKL